MHFLPLYHGGISQRYLSASKAFPLKYPEFYTMITPMEERIGLVTKSFDKTSITVIKLGSAISWFAIPSGSRGTTPTSRRLERWISTTSRYRKPPAAS